jgi:SAM-dependent methyltransferase
VPHPFPDNQGIPRPGSGFLKFYATPRLAGHLDTSAQVAWQHFHGEFLRPGLSVLDLMASHDSHLPASPDLATVVGLGMNAVELDANLRLSERHVHNLNTDAQLPYADGRFDLAICSLSIEYLQRPVAVLQDLRRCLKPGGRCILSFSERWFPPKAVTPWASLAPFARVAWVLRHLRDAGFVDLETYSRRGKPRPPEDKYARQTALSDPLYAVTGIQSS